MNQTPKHIAIIMDGNGRWAKGHGVKRTEGHWEGARRAEEITIAASEAGVKVLTLFAFSDENWERPLSEINALMDLLVCFLKQKKDSMCKNGISFGMIGDVSRLSPDVQDVILDVKNATSGGGKLKLILALSYGSKSEICRAVNRAIKCGEKNITPEMVDRYLDTNGLPPLDLVIRTSGELRVSNFLLWQAAYAEFYFTQKMWPDFGKEDLLAAIEDYRCRSRRFGKTEED